MRSRKQTRYFCDFCPKSGVRRPSMEKHEKGCTANPNRVCGLCAYTARVLGTTTGQATSLQLEGAAHQGIAKLREVAGGCPACMLVGIRRAKKSHYSESSEDGYPRPLPDELLEFKYKEEAAEIWRLWNPIREKDEGEARKAAVARFMTVKQCAECDNTAELGFTLCNLCFVKRFIELKQSAAISI